MAAKVAFRGGFTCTCVATSLPWVEQDMIGRGIITHNIDIAQLGWRGDVGASAGTHDEGGCTDTWGQWGPGAIDVWRIWGWTMQRRDLSGIKTHAHGWPYGCDHLAPAADKQARDWDNGRNGLVNGGPIAGRHPVKHWQQAMEEGIQRMYTLDDIADAVLARRDSIADAVLRRRNEIVEAVWTKDGYVNNVGFAPGTAGNYVSASDALEGLMAQLKKAPGAGTIANAVAEQQADELAAVNKKLDALTAAVAALAAKP